MEHSASPPFNHPIMWCSMCGLYMILRKLDDSSQLNVKLLQVVPLLLQPRSGSLTHCVFISPATLSRNLLAAAWEVCRPNKLRRRTTVKQRLLCPQSMGHFFCRHFSGCKLNIKHDSDKTRGQSEILDYCEKPPTITL